MARYEKGIVTNTDLSNFNRPNVVSLWWKDVCGLSVVPGRRLDWFRGVVSKKYGCGTGT